MKSFEQQLKEIIIDNVPKNIPLTLPISEDRPLQEQLSKTYELVYNTNNETKELKKTMQSILYELYANNNDNYMRSKF